MVSECSEPAEIDCRLSFVFGDQIVACSTFNSVLSGVNTFMKVVNPLRVTVMKVNQKVSLQVKLCSVLIRWFWTLSKLGKKVLWWQRTMLNNSIGSFGPSLLVVFHEFKSAWKPLIGNTFTNFSKLLKAAFWNKIKTQNKLIYFRKENLASLDN